MHTLFISDLHLCPQQPAIAELFITFLADTARKADALYILGDLFETWIGDDDHSAFVQRVKQALKETAAAGVSLYLMAGNRDFLLGERFVQEVGAQLLADPCVINLYGKPTLLTHGDLLCTDDVKYLKFRSWVRKPLLQKIFLSLPFFFRRNIATALRRKSAEHVKTAAKEIMDVSQTAVINYLQQYQVAQLVHGHTHQPTIHYFFEQQKLFLRITLSDWHEQGNVLIYNEDQKSSLINFKT